MKTLKLMLISLMISCAITSLEATGQPDDDELHTELTGLTAILKSEQERNNQLLLQHSDEFYIEGGDEMMKEATRLSNACIKRSNGTIMKLIQEIEKLENKESNESLKETDKLDDDLLTRLKVQRALEQKRNSELCVRYECFLREDIPGHPKISLRIKTPVPGKLTSEIELF